MKIAGVDIFPLLYPLQQPYGDANGYKKYRSLFLLRITTESGITGWGECTDWLPALKLGFENRLIPYLIGKMASDRTQLVQHIRKWHGRSATGVSMALTEIAAKSYGCSVCDLWGGKRRNQVPVYASFQSYTELTDWIAHSIRMVERAVDDGFQKVKVKVGGKSFEEDYSHIAQIQQQLMDKCRLIVDANQSYDLSTARRWGRAMADWGNIEWFEEPLPMDAVQDYTTLRANFPASVAGGENLQTAAQFLPLLKAGAMDMIQPDVAHMDGVDGYRHLLQLARDFGIRVSPHAFDGALTRLYAIFAQACLSPWSKMNEQAIEPVEWDAMDNPFSSIIPVRPVNGLVSVSEGPGIGVELDMDVVKKYLWNGSAY